MLTSSCSSGFANNVMFVLSDLLEMICSSLNFGGAVDVDSDECSRKMISHDK